MTAMTFTEEQKKQLQRKKQLLLLYGPKLTSLDMSDTAPRFLFRGWSSWSGNHSAQEELADLNTEEEIRPHAFSDDHSLKARKLWETPNVRSMVYNHLWGLKHPLSQFSSWSHDLGVAVYFATRALYFHDPECEVYISVIDREALPARNMAYHVNDLLKICAIPFKEINFEYLVHGVVNGPGLACVKLSDLYSAGFDLYPPKGVKPTYRSVFYRLDEPLTQCAIRFARQFKFQPESSPDHVPLLFFLAATWMANTMREDKSLDLENPSGLQEFCRAFVRAVQDEFQALLPEDFAGHFRHAISLIKDRPDAHRPLILLQAMTHFTWGLQRRDSVEQNYLDFKEITLKRKLSVGREMEALITDFQDLGKSLMKTNREPGVRQVKRTKAERIEDTQGSKGSKKGQGSPKLHPSS